MQGKSASPIQFCPCSQHIALTVRGHGDNSRRGDMLCIFTTGLVLVYTSPKAGPWSHSVHAEHLQSDFAFDGTLIGAHRSSDASASYLPDICWHPSDPAPETGAAADLAGKLLAGLAAGDILGRLAWSPYNGLAAVVEVPQHLGSEEQGTSEGGKKTLSKLYVLVPGSQVASMMLPDDFGFYGTLRWSPSGDRLLVGNSLRAADTQLVSDTCRLVERLPCCMAVFSPDGNLVAAAVFEPAQASAVKLFRAAGLCHDLQQPALPASELQ